MKVNVFNVFAFYRGGTLKGKYYIKKQKITRKLKPLYLHFMNSMQTFNASFIIHTVMLLYADINTLYIWVLTGGIIVIDKYINKHVYLLTLFKVLNMCLNR